MKNKIYHTVGTFPKTKRKIVDRGKIDTPNTQIHDRSLSCLGTIHTSNYDGHISKYVYKIGKCNQKGIIFSCNTILVHMKKNK
jgi:hypothetical protein